MDWLVSLRYPDGRTHETTIAVPETLRPGAEFDAFGRRWRVAGAEPVDSDGEVERLICESVGFDGRTLLGRVGEREEWSTRTA